MKTPHTITVGAAAVLAMGIAAFAQTTEPRPTSDTARAGRQAEAEVTLVGCIQREAEYRKASESGRGGPAATGLGLGNEFVLVNATRTTAGAAPSTTVSDCAATGSGEAYELTGSRERDLAKFVGRRLEITGTLKEAKTTTAPDGAPKPTGGFDPLKQDLKLFEVEIASFREPAAGQRAEVTQPAAPAAPPVSSAQPEPQQRASAETRPQLPRAASSRPLVGLLGVLLLAGGIGLRFSTRRA